MIYFIAPKREKHQVSFFEVAKAFFPYGFSLIT